MSAMEGTKVIETIRIYTSIDMVYFIELGIDKLVIPQILCVHSEFARVHPCGSHTLVFPQSTLTCMPSNPSNL
jgi:hypothetical protein